LSISSRYEDHCNNDDYSFTNLTHFLSHSSRFLFRLKTITFFRASIFPKLTRKIARWTYVDVFPLAASMTAVRLRRRGFCKFNAATPPLGGSIEKSCPSIGNIDNSTEFVNLEICFDFEWNKTKRFGEPESFCKLELSPIFFLFCRVKCTLTYQRNLEALSGGISSLDFN
jgi:hypothetical protein